MSTIFGHSANTSRWRELLKTSPDAGTPGEPGEAEARGEPGEPFNQGGGAAGAYGQGERLQETRDGNLSSILAQIRDYGPAILGSAAEPQEPPEPPEPVRFPGPADASQAEREKPPAPPGRSGPQTTPNLPPEPAAPARWWPTSSMAIAVLAAILVTGGVIAVIYRSPLETEPRRERVADGGPVLREELAALQTAISKLTERIETIAAADKTPRQELVLGEPLDVSGWVQLNTRRTPRQEAAVGERPDPASGPAADPERPRRGADGLEVKLDMLEQRMDAMAEKMLRLTTETERSLAQVLAALAVLANSSPQRMASPLAEQNTAAAKPVAPEAGQGGGAAAGNPPAVAKSVGEAKAAALRVAPGNGLSHTGPLAGAPVLASAADPSSQPATLPPADLSAKARVPLTGTNPHPGAPVAAAEHLAVRNDPQGGESVDEAAPHRPAPTLPLPKVEQQKGQRLAAILGDGVTIRADAVTVPSVREGQVVASREAADPLAPLLAAQQKGLAKLEMPTVPGGRSAAAGAPSAPVVPAAAGSKAPPPVAEGEWFINLIAVRSKSTALELQRTYRAKGVDAQVIAFTRNGPFGVSVGGFNSRRDAVDRAPAIKTALGIRHVWIARR